MSEWQPIDTAPKDGTEVLGWRYDFGILLIRWDAPINFCTEDEINSLDTESAESYDWFCADFISGGRLEGYEIPTHWMPLPEPPKE